MPVDYLTEIQLAYLRAVTTAITEEEAVVQLYRQYFDGEQGVILTDRQREYLAQGADIESWANICKRVVSVVKDRLELAPHGISPADEMSGEYAQLVTEWWSANNLGQLQKSIYEAALRDGSVGIIVGWNGEHPTFTPNIVYDGTSGLIRFHYDSDGNYLFASKRWRPWDMVKLTLSSAMRLNVYLPGEIQRYISGGRGSFANWRLMDGEELAAEFGQVIPNPQPWIARDGSPLGVPVVPFNAPGGSEISDVLTAQKAMNHGIGAFDEAIDYHNNPLLWASGLQLGIDAATGKPEIPDFGAGSILLVGEGNEVSRIDPPDLERMFRAGVLSWVDLIGLVKGWPLFVLNRSQQPPSGVALRVMEGELLSQVYDTQTAFSGGWRQAFDVGRRIYEAQTGRSLPGQLVLEWEPAETSDPLADVEAKAKMWESADVPILQRWREAGYTDDQIEQMIEDKQREDDFGLILGDVTQ